MIRNLVILSTVVAVAAVLAFTAIESLLEAIEEWDG